MYCANKVISLLYALCAVQNVLEKKTRNIQTGLRWSNFFLTHWGRVTHICINNLTNIGSDNGFSPHRYRAIIWTNDGILLIGPLGPNFSEILIDIQPLSFKKMHFKMSSGKWWPFCLRISLLKYSFISLHLESCLSFVGGSLQTECCLQEARVPRSSGTWCWKQ